MYITLSYCFSYEASLALLKFFELLRKVSLNRIQFSISHCIYHHHPSYHAVIYYTPKENISLILPKLLKFFPKWYLDFFRFFFFVFFSCILTIL